MVSLPPTNTQCRSTPQNQARALFAFSKFLQSFIKRRFSEERIVVPAQLFNNNTMIYTAFLTRMSLKYLSDVLMFSLYSNVLENQYFLPWNIFRSINHGFRLIIIQEPRAKAGEIWPRGKLNSTFIIYERIMTLTLSDVSAIRAIQHNAPHTTIR